MNRKILFGALSAASLLALGVVGAAHAGGGGTRADGDYRVEARMELGNDQMQGKSRYRERLRGSTLVQRFNVEIEDADPDTMYQVHINGVLFGTIVSDGFGFAEIEFRTAVVDDNPNDEEPPLPTDFPRIEVGDTVTVGPLSGTYE